MAEAVLDEFAAPMLKPDTQYSRRLSNPNF